MADLKYFVFDDELWAKGYFYNFKISDSDNGLCILKNENEDLKEQVLPIKAIYFSSPLDSHEKETIWHRMRMDYSNFGDGKIMFSYYAADTDEFLYNGIKTSVCAVINDEKMEIADKVEILKSIWVEEKLDPKDILLYEAKGRYLWFKIEITAYDDILPKINGLKIEFPMNSITRLLPEFYTNDEKNSMFLKKYLGIFQSLIYDLQENIDNVSELFDIDSADDEFLYWLSGWLSIDNPYIWGKEKLKKLIKINFDLYSKKGTKSGLCDLVELYSGEKPIIKETYEILDAGENYSYISEYKKLYGDNRYSFFVFVSEKSIKDNKHYMELKKIVDLYKPVNTVPNIVVLKPFMVLGQHTYIGINSNISKNSALELNGSATLPFNTTILE